MKLSRKFTSPPRPTRQANKCTPSPRKIRRMNKTAIKTLNVGFFDPTPPPEPPKLTGHACESSDKEYMLYMGKFEDNESLIDAMIINDDGTVRIYNREANCVRYEMDKIPKYMADGLYCEYTLGDDSDNQEELVSCITILESDQYAYPCSVMYLMLCITPTRIDVNDERHTG